MATFFFLFLSCFILAQTWEDKLLEKNKRPDIFEKLSAFESHKKSRPYERGNGYKPYEREMDFIIERVSNGGPFNANALYKEWKKENEKYLHVNSNSAGNWISLGPTNTHIILSNG